MNDEEEIYRLEVVTDENESKNRKRSTNGKGPVPEKISKTSPRNFLGSLFAPFRSMFGSTSAFEEEEEEIQVIQSEEESDEGRRDSVEIIAITAQEEVIITSPKSAVCLPKPLPVEEEVERSFEEQPEAEDEVQVVGEVTVSPKTLLEDQRRSIEEVMVAVVSAEDASSDSISIVSGSQPDRSPGPDDSISRQNTPRDFLDEFHTPRDSWSRRRKGHLRPTTERRTAIAKVGQGSSLGRIKKSGRTGSTTPFFTPKTGTVNSGYRIYAEKLKELSRADRAGYVPNRITSRPLRPFMRNPCFNAEEYVARAREVIASISQAADVVSLDDTISIKSSSSSSVQVLSGDEVEVLSTNSGSLYNYASSARGRLDDILGGVSSSTMKTKTALASRGQYCTEKSARSRHEKELGLQTKLLQENRKANETAFEDDIRERLALMGIKTPAVKPKEKDEFPELPQEAIDIVNRAWGRANPSEVLSEGFDLKVTRKDLQTLSGLSWLNDEVIAFFLQLIVARSAKDSSLPKVYAFNTFFYPNIATKGYASVKRWTRKVDIFSYNMLLVPVHVNKVHWCLAIVDLAEKRIEYIDSMHGTGNKCLSDLQNYLKEESRDKKKIEFDMNGWEYINVTDGPSQKNGSDCGVFSCRTAEYRSRRRALNFGQEHMPYFRQRMVYEIVTKQLM